MFRDYIVICSENNEKVEDSLQVEVISREKSNESQPKHGNVKHEFRWMSLRIWGFTVRNSWQRSGGMDDLQVSEKIYGRRD